MPIIVDGTPPPPDPSGVDLLSLADAKAHLNITNSRNDTELQFWIDAATDVIEDLIGSVVPRQYVEQYDGGAMTVALRHTPVLSVESVTEYTGAALWTLTSQPVGQAVDYYGFSLDDPAAGIVTRRGTYSTAIAFMRGRGTVQVSYTAGRATIPVAVQAAARIIVGHLWTTQRGAGPMPMQPGGDAGEVAVAGYAVPSRAVELLGRYVRMPGIG